MHIKNISIKNRLIGVLTFVALIILVIIYIFLNGWPWDRASAEKAALVKVISKSFDTTYYVDKTTYNFFENRYNVYVRSNLNGSAEMMVIDSVTWRQFEQ